MHIPTDYKNYTIDLLASVRVALSLYTLLKYRKPKILILSSLYNHTMNPSGTMTKLLFCLLQDFLFFLYWGITHSAGQWNCSYSISACFCTEGAFVIQTLSLFYFQHFHWGTKITNDIWFKCGSVKHTQTWSKELKEKVNFQHHLQGSFSINTLASFEIKNAEQKKR